MTAARVTVEFTSPSGQASRVEFDLDTDGNRSPCDAVAAIAAVIPSPAVWSVVPRGGVHSGSGTGVE